MASAISIFTILHLPEPSENFIPKHAAYATGLWMSSEMNGITVFPMDTKAKSSLSKNIGTANPELIHVSKKAV